MDANYFEKRKSGIPLIGEINWGTSLCQFYQTREDLLEILVPYVQSGLENNEFCVWVTSDAMNEQDARQALNKAIPVLTKYDQKGQIEFVPYRMWDIRGQKSGKSIQAMLDTAIPRGFDGLRIIVNSTGNRKNKNSSNGLTEVISRYNVISMFAYPRNEFDAVRLMETVKNHQYALIHNTDKWEIIESSEARIAASALTRSEEKLRSLFNNMAEGFAYHRIVLDCDWSPCDYVFLEVNEAFERQIGIKAKDIIGKRVTEVLPGIEKDPADWIGKYGKVALTSKPISFESYAEPLKKWYSVSAFSSQKGFFAVTFSDITQKKNYENDLLRAKIEWERTFNSVPDLIALLDGQHRIIRANKAMADRMGLTPDQCVGMHCYQVVHGLSHSPAFCPHTLTCCDGKEHVTEVHESRLGGDYLVSTTPIMDDKGCIIGSTHVARDITESKRAENALKVNNERLKILSEASSLLLSSNTPESIVQTIATKVMVHLGCDCFFNFISDENAGKLRLNAYAGIPPEAAKGIEWLTYGEAICGCAARDGYRIVSENVQENNDSRAALVRSFGVQAYAAHPLKIGVKTIGTLSFGTRSRTFFAEDELELMQTVAGQVSVAMERKWVEEALKRRTQELEASNKELESFSYTVSHDLRAPLRSMDGYSQALLEDYADKLDQQGKGWLGVIRSSSQMMAQLIDDILGLSRVVRAELLLQNVNLSDLANSVIKDLRQSQPERQVAFEIEPGLEAFGDPNLLRVLLNNLLGNAFKFTGKCQNAQIEFGITELNGQPFYFVKDNGAGFDMTYANKLFKAFQRLHAEEEFFGTGIGLATVQRIVQRHNGKVLAKGEVGKGATFYFSLNQEGK